MKENIEIIKCSKMENIILKLIIIAFCILTFILNSDLYSSIFKDNSVITTYESLEKAISYNNKFITLDLTNAELIKFSIVRDDKSENISVYSLPLGDKKLLLSLKENTALTNEVTGELLNYDINMSEIKNQLEENGDDEFILEKYFSNVNYTTSEYNLKIKFYFILGLIFIMLITLPFDIIFYINPKKTYKFKKYVKKINEDKITKKTNS